MNERPLQRVHDLVVTGSGDDLLVYDTTTHTLHTLNPVLAKLFRRCDGTTTAADLARETGIDRDDVDLALHQLRQAGLLDGDIPAELPVRTSRRRLLRKAGIAIGAPAIVSVTAPMATAAASGCTPSGEPCSINNPGACCSGSCSNFNPPAPPVCI